MPYSNLLKLPQVTFRFSRPSVGPSYVVVAGGRSPDVKWFARFSSDREIWAADSGLDICARADVLPERIIGDFDSVSSESMAWAERNGLFPERFSPDKDLTDLQLVLRTIRAKNREASIFLTGCWGGRYDHIQSNVFSLLGHCKSASGISCMTDEREVLLFVGGEEAMDISFTAQPLTLSLIPFSETCHGVYLKGTRWELENAMLERDEPWAISNRIIPGKTVQLKLKEGWLGLYLEWK
jgi:thiamine pyrophosphokinase